MRDIRNTSYFLTYFLSFQRYPTLRVTKKKLPAHIKYFVFVVFCSFLDLCSAIKDNFPITHVKDASVFPASHARLSIARPLSLHHAFPVSRI